MTPDRTLYGNGSLDLWIWRQKFASSSPGAGAHAVVGVGVGRSESSWIISKHMEHPKHNKKDPVYSFIFLTMITFGQFDKFCVSNKSIG